MGSVRARTASAIALLAAVALLASACTVPDSEGAREKNPHRTGPSIIDPGSAPSVPGTPTTTGRAAPRSHDVPDPVFPGYGDPRIDVASYDVTVKADPGKALIEGHEVIELSPVGGTPLSSFTLDLDGPTMRQVAVDGIPARVQAGSGDRSHEWIITPNAPLLPHTTTTVDILYAGMPDLKPFPTFGIPIGWQRDDHGGWFTMSEPHGTENWVPVS